MGTDRVKGSSKLTAGGRLSLLADRVAMALQVCLEGLECVASHASRVSHGELQSHDIPYATPLGCQVRFGFFNGSSRVGDLV